MSSRLLGFFVAGLLAVFFMIPTAFATPAPELDPITSPIHATKAVISGHTEPGYKIVVTGGTYQIPPTHADDNGYFEIQVSLVAESINLYYVKAVDENDVASEQIEVEIIEGEIAAAEAEAEGGGDRTAPGAPQMNAVPETMDASTYLFVGTAEPDSTILISGTQSGSTRVNTNGAWQIFLNIKQNSVNNFTFTAKDAAGNVSPGVKVTLTEASQKPAVEIEVTETEEDVQIAITENNTDTETEPEIRVIVLTDIAKHWAKDYILDLIKDGVVAGYSDNTFRPDNPVTRAEFIKMVVNAFGYDVNENPENIPFADVSASAWFAPYVDVAAKMDIVDGYSDGTFRPGNTVNRAEAMKILLTAAGVDTKNAPSSDFPDVSDNDWFAPYVLKARSMGIVGGYTNGNFGPADAMTRGQVAKVLVELMERL